MLASVIVSVALGVIFLLIAILYKKKYLFRIILGTLGIVLLLYGGFSYGALRPIADIETFDVGNTSDIEYPIKKVQVTSPVEGDTVNCRILSMGVYPKGHNKDIWVLLRPSDQKYYPQSDYTNTSYKENGKWQVVTRFGGDKGEIFDLVVYETDSLASAFFSETILKWKDSNQYEGLSSAMLPPGAKEIERIQVKLKRDCRGVF
ncbi:hypothetical protein [Mesohalobacter halotolerans]|uniref:DUF2892 domain-containing protein n=1 Tax=Mesohalobacter halotolerans TaxID=1883405 RepID=A0A4U5TR71_9FLAO|nr:hypothetical protein [Mesohalobacter halotolerans]MBS3737641.1 hypothetical protein [Psychroflexus sp.]TKS56576.1 hypothetical protein FCN74_05935 [Mesohalobacter halotolerans]